MSLFADDVTGGDQGFLGFLCQKVAVLIARLSNEEFEVVIHPSVRVLSMWW